MGKKYIVINLPNEYDDRFEIIQEELFNIGFEWRESQTRLKRYYPPKSNIFMLDNRLYLIDDGDINYISKKNNIIRFDIVSYIRYLKIKKLRYGK
ncbi:MAG: hypothetical protein ACOC2W_03875 [bacterium]